MTKFIGGCADGRDIPEGQNGLNVRIPTKLEDGSISSDVYRLEWIFAEDCSVEVFVEESIPDYQMLYKLIEGYEPHAAAKLAELREWLADMPAAGWFIKEPILEILNKTHASQSA